MRTSERSRTAGRSTSWEQCQQRQDLLSRLRDALQDFGVAVQESRGRGPAAAPDRTEAAGAVCAQAWADLCKHQDEHGCWRQPKDGQ